MKRAANLSVDADLLIEAKSLNINLSQTLESALRKDVLKARSLQWKKDNKAAIESSNAWVDEHGLPLVKHRQF